MPLSRPSGGWKEDRTKGEPAAPFPLPTLLRARRAMAETGGKIETVLSALLRTFAPLDLGLVKSKESGRSRAVHACAKVPAVQPRATVKPVLQTAAISAAPYRFEDASRLSIFDMPSHKHFH